MALWTEIIPNYSYATEQSHFPSSRKKLRTLFVQNTPLTNLQALCINIPSWTTFRPSPSSIFRIEDVIDELLEML
uniref:Uncharacterized protein n=1 Tax=Oryza brachyantha TaxID=4533 RepID=J3L4H4_ORYBR